MHSITDLNTSANVAVSFTDNRTPGATFNRPISQDQYLTLDAGVSSVVVPLGIDIIDIYNMPGNANIAWSNFNSGFGVGIWYAVSVDSANVTIDVDSTLAANVGYRYWNGPTDANGVPVRLAITTSTLTFQGIHTIEQWDALKNITVRETPGSGSFSNHFTITSSISYTNHIGIEMLSPSWTTYVNPVIFNIEYRANTEITLADGQRNYTKNTINSVFPDNVPILSESTSSTATFALTFTLGSVGFIGISETNLYTTSHTFTGNVSYINSIFQDLKYYPTKNYVSTWSLGYSLTRNGVLKDSGYITMSGLENTSPIPGQGIIEFTPDMGQITFSPTYYQRYYLNAEILAVGGGGGGQLIGGGGGGGYAYVINTVLSQPSYIVRPGSGGAGGVGGGFGYEHADSGNHSYIQFSSNSSYVIAGWGGKYGALTTLVGSTNVANKPGGNSPNQAGSYVYLGGKRPTSGTTVSGYLTGGGGAGIGANGGAGGGLRPGNGGNGLQVTFNGVTAYYGGGGAGGNNGGNYPASGGLGGGGSTPSSGNTGIDGLDGYGGGGAGGRGDQYGSSTNPGRGGNGGNGIIKIRFYE